MPTPKLLRQPVLLACASLALLAGCASDRLERTAPAGVNLTGEWRFNPNLSDDADKLDTGEKPTTSPTPSHRPHGGGRGSGGGMPPIGTPPDSNYDFLPTALVLPGIEQTAQLPPATTSSSGSANTRGATISRYLKAPVTMSIVQKESTVIIKANMADGTTTADEFACGTQNNIPYGQDGTADRTVGWRGQVFVVTLAPKKGGFREDDFALDDDGRLIMTTFTKGGHLGKIEIKRVYDRMASTR